MPAIQKHFRHVCRHMRMSRSATPATQKHITTRFDTVKQDRFCNFPHRHGEARRKPETRDQTRWSIKTSISCETSSNFHTLFLHVPSKSTFSYEFFDEHRNLLPENRCLVRGFRQFSAHLTKGHARHALCTLSPLDAALKMRFGNTRDTTRLKCCACHAK